jgi:hypothetical protein
MGETPVVTPVVTPPFRIFVGFDPREMRASVVAEWSMRVRAQKPITLARIGRLSLLRAYRRPTQEIDGRLWDEISRAPMSTDHAIARFFVPYLCDYQGWALFTDGDVFARRDVADLFALADPRYAVMVVPHPDVAEAGVKKGGGHMQLAYPRKLWSSVILWNCGHEANTRLTLDVLNAWTGLELHGFTWLQDSEIGALPPEWNYCVGVNPRQADPAICHYTLGTPDTTGYIGHFEDEWIAIARAAGYAIQVPA